MAFEFKGFSKPRYDNTQFGKVRFIRKKGRIIPIINKKRVGRGLESAGEDIAAFGIGTMGFGLAGSKAKSTVKKAVGGFQKKVSKFLGITRQTGTFSLKKGATVGVSKKTGKFVSPDFSIRKSKGIFGKITGLRDIKSVTRGYKSPSRAKLGLFKKITNVRSAFAAGKVLLKPRVATKVGFAVTLLGAISYGIGTELQLQTKSGKTVK